jgi:hypothetical protein
LPSFASLVEGHTKSHVLDRGAPSNCSLGRTLQFLVVAVAALQLMRGTGSILAGDFGKRDGVSEALRSPRGQPPDRLERTMSHRRELFPYRAV